MTVQTATKHFTSKTQGLPLFYNDIAPINQIEHSALRMRPITSLAECARTHAIPVIIDEFPRVQRHYPIVFSTGETPVPIALMGLNEGVNVFLDDRGWPIDPDVYVPAYIRRYPFLLAKLQRGSDELSLCYDPSAGVVGNFEEGEPIFEGEQPSVATESILEFCVWFEEGGQATKAFCDELLRLDLLMDGDVAIQAEGFDEPFIYRGFRMIDEDKLHKLKGPEVRRMIKTGMLPLIFAHLFSLSLVRNVFARQVDQEKVPVVRTNDD